MRTWTAVVWLAVGCCGLDDEKAFGTFIQWLKDQGVSFGAPFSLGVDPATGLRGILAGERIKSGTELFSVPKSLVLTLETVQSQGSTWQSCTAGGDDAKFLSPVHTAFALFLLEQRAQGASLHPWVSVMPTSFGLPGFYDKDQLEWFQASPLRKVVSLDWAAIGQDAVAAAEKWSGLGVGDFRWARAAVKSRVFGLKSLSGGQLSQEKVAMVPFADFVNHPPDGIVEANAGPSYDPQSGIFRFVASRDIGVGEGVYWDYGFKSNRHSMLRYGFVAKERVGLTDLPLFFNIKDLPGPPSAAKNAKLELIEEAVRNERLAMDPDGSVMHELALSLTSVSATRLLGHARFMVLQTKNSSVLREYCESTYCNPIGLPNERQALKHLVTILEAISAAYNTSVQEDKEVLDSGTLNAGDPRWNAVVIRYGEKQILRGFVRLLQTLDGLFDLSPWALAEAISDRWKNPDSDIHRYVQQNMTDLLTLETLRWAKRHQKAAKESTKKA